MPSSFLKPKTVRILSLDGGGSRGYFSAKFLKKFCDSWGINPNELFNHFDIICGASTGGILALAYAYGLSPENMCTFYREKTPWIFTIRTAAEKIIGSHTAGTPSNRPNLAQKLIMIAENDPFYKAAYNDSNYGDVRLASEATEIFGETKLTDLTVPVLLTSYDATNETPIMFSNVDHRDYLRDNITCVDAMMATAAAPVYLPKRSITNPITEETAEYIDGGIFQLNVTALGYATARRLHPYANRYCILSIGTGINQIGFSPADATRLMTLESDVKKLVNDVKIGGETSEQTEEKLNSILLNQSNLKSGGTGELSAVGDEVKELIGLIDREMTSGQLAIHKFFQMLSSVEDINLFYYRFDAQLDLNRDTEMDNSTSDFFDYLDDVVNAKYQEDAEEIGTFIGRLVDGD